MSKVFEAIVAMDENNGISVNTCIPWKSKTDLNFFKTKTINNMFVTEEKLLQFVKNPESYFDITKHPYLSKNYNIYLIGGEQVYRTFCIYCSTIWITKIKSDYKCDLIFSFDLTAYDKTIEYEDDEMQIMRFQRAHQLGSGSGSLMK